MVMAQYAINDTSLTAIGDAIRAKKGEDKYLYLNLFDGVITLPEGQERTTSYYDIPVDKDTWRQFVEGTTLTIVKQSKERPYITVYCWGSNRTHLGNFRINLSSPYTITSSVANYFQNAEEISFEDRNYGLYNGEEIIIQSNIQGGLNPETTYLPSEMAGEIENLMIMPDYLLKWSGDCNKKCANNTMNQFLNDFGDKLTTENITDTSYMFDDSAELEYDLSNLVLNCSAYNLNIYNMFSSCRKIETLPTIQGNFEINSMNSLFNSCDRLRYIPDDWIDIQKVKTNAQPYGLFAYCKSLRKIPDWALELPLKATSNQWNYLPYYQLANQNFVLDELCELELPINASSEISSSQVMQDMFNACYRLSRFTFATDGNGNPKYNYGIRFNNLTLDLSNFVGWGYANDITRYNSGITADKQVSDQASYDLLKDDPDWFTTDRNWSRYNHTSAVETIKSLPIIYGYDQGKHCTIKFKGQSGTNTDGGAISTLTASEIAVATDKGWTVSIV